MRLYHAPRTRSLRVLWALEETGAPYELTVLTREERDSEEHRARHPLGKVPALEDDDGLLFESGALCLHVADSYPQANLIGPPGSHERGLVYQWVLYAFSELEPGFAGFVGNRETDPERAAASKERFRTAAAAVESALDGHDFLVADRFTVADVIYGEFLGVCRGVGLTEGLPNVSAYVDRMEERPARKRADAIGQA
jgi:glutathione S-transferase